jgi:hypothetical protein
MQKTLQEDTDLARTIKPKTKAQLTKAANVRKRTKGEATDDSEDDFKPKKVTKARAPAKPRTKPAASLPSASISAITTAEPSTSGSGSNSPVKREFSTLSESDSEVLPVPKKPAARPRAKKPVTIDMDDSDDESESC